MPAKKAATRKPARRSLEATPEYAKVCYYGLYGSGKTTHLAHAVNLCEDDQIVVYINAEGGLKKKPLADVFGLDLSKIELFPGPGEDHAFDDLMGLFSDCKTRLNDKPGSIQAVLWDSTSDAQKQILDPIVEYNVARTNSKKSESDFARSRFDYYQEDWGESVETMSYLIRHFRSLPCHFGVSALMRRDTDKNTGEVHYGPAVSPALQNTFAAYFDMILHTVEEEVEGQDDPIYVAYTRKHGVYEAKDRFHVLPRKLAYPRMDRVVQYVNGGLTEEDDQLHQQVRKMAQRRTHDGPAASAPKRPAEQFGELTDEKAS